MAITESIETTQIKQLAKKKKKKKKTLPALSANSICDFYISEEILLHSTTSTRFGFDIGNSLK